MDCSLLAKSKDSCRGEKIQIIMLVKSCLSEWAGFGSVGLLILGDVRCLDFPNLVSLSFQKTTSPQVKDDFISFPPPKKEKLQSDPEKPPMFFHHPSYNANFERKDPWLGLNSLGDTVLSL